MEMQKNPEFTHFIEELQQTQTKGLLLKDFLIKPVQRILKYPLLFREMLKETAEGSEDHTVLANVLEKINAIATLINEASTSFFS